MNGLPGRLRSIKPVVADPAAASRYCLTPAGHATSLSAIPARSIVKRRLLTGLKESGVMHIEEVKRLSRRAPAVLREFITLRWVEETLAAHPSTVASLSEITSPGPVLTADQQNAVNDIAAKISDFNTWLLHGITGSGKTEVYLQLISLLLRQERQALVLVPEIN
ncbi:DEAD/DEAH box helicase family protein, partial [Nitrosospira multiformis]